MTNRERATYLLRHYLKIVYGQSGLLWYDAMDKEIAEIVDCIIDAARGNEQS